MGTRTGWSCPSWTAGAWGLDTGEEGPWDLEEQRPRQGGGEGGGGEGPAPDSPMGLGLHVCRWRVAESRVAQGWRLTTLRSWGAQGSGSGAS